MVEIRNLSRQRLLWMQEWLKKAEDLAAEGKTPLFFAKEDQLIGIIAVADVIKEDSQRQSKNCRIWESMW